MSNRVRSNVSESVHAEQIHVVGRHVHRQLGTERKRRSNSFQPGIRLSEYYAYPPYHTGRFSSRRSSPRSERTRFKLASDPFQGKDLPAKDLSGTSDPYVRVTLLPDKKHRLETKIKRRTLNPRWNETFYFEGKRSSKFETIRRSECAVTIKYTATKDLSTVSLRIVRHGVYFFLATGFPIQKLQSRVLHLHVFDYDRFSRDDSIGEMFLPLCQVISNRKTTYLRSGS